MTSLTLVRHIAARPELVFDAITTPDGIAHWWGPDAGQVLLADADLRVGGRFRVRFRMLDGTEHECSGEFLEVVRPVRVAMSGRWLGRESEGESRVEIALRPIGAGTELVFTHALLPTEQSREEHEHPRSRANASNRASRDLPTMYRLTPCDSSGLRAAMRKQQDFKDGTEWDMPMLNVFRREGAVVRHFWGSEMLYVPPEPGQYYRHNDLLDPLWNLLDTTREGRGQFQPKLAY